MLVPSLWIAAPRRRKGLRACAKITYQFGIPSSGHLRPPLNSEILNVATAAPALSLNRVSQICTKSGRQFWEVILAQALSTALALLVIMVFGCSLENSFIFHPSRPIVATPEDVGLPYEDVTLTTTDGTRINGWFVPSPGAKSTLLWFHGNAGNISHRVDNIRKLHDRVPAHIFIIDYRGYGRSQGVISEDGTYQDADAALAYLHSREDIDANHIVVFGRSLGAAVGVDLATRKDTRALILESPFVSIKAMAKTLLPLVPIGPFLRTRYDNLAKIPNLRTPLLILHGDSDRIVPYEQGTELFAAAPEPKVFYTIRAAGHNDTYLVGGNEYFEAIANFIEQSKKVRDDSHLSPCLRQQESHEHDNSQSAYHRWLGFRRRGRAPG